MSNEIPHCSCGRVARFMIRRLNRKTRKVGKWTPVCGTCDSKIGIQNLVACGLTQKEAIEINRAVKKVKE